MDNFNINCNRNLNKLKWIKNLNLCVFDSIDLYMLIKDKYKIISQGLSSLKSLPMQNKLLGPPFSINVLETAYIYMLNSNIIENADEFADYYNNIYLKEDKFKVEDITEKQIEYLVYKDLKYKGYYVLSGFKYGSEFLIYKEDPNFYHSEYMIIIDKSILLNRSYVIDRNKNSAENTKEYDIINNNALSTEEAFFLNIQRIANNTKKKLLVALLTVDNSSNKKLNIKYLNYSWINI